MTESAGMRRTGRDAGWHAIGLGQIFVVNLVDAQRALLHRAVVFVELARAVRARPGAELAADAGIRIDENDAVLGALIGSTCRAHGATSRLLAMQAGARKVHGARCLALSCFVGVAAVEPHAVRLALEIAQRT